MKNLRPRLCRNLAGLALLASVAAGAEVRLPHVLSDHAVLQRNAPVRIWGWAAPSESVTVSLHDQKKTATADVYGQWEVWLLPEKAGGPYELTVSGSATANPLKRSDLLFGEVWVASGQSNMEMPLAGFPNAPIKDGPETIAAANHPQMRLLLQKRRTSDVPLADSDDTWQLCTPETARTFSAAAYFFGRKIMQEEKVPIGLIDTSWGGTPSQAWISNEGVGWANLTSIAIDNGVIARANELYQIARTQSDAEDAAARAAGKPAPTHTPLPPNRAPWVQSTLYNAMVAPYTKYAIRGVIWYQGETEHDVPNRAYAYSRVFPAMIQDWRRQWAQGEFPFLFVQISSYNGGQGWSRARDAQRRTLELGNTGMAVTSDIGLATNIHPPDKQTVGLRLAQSALGMVYGRKVETSSPLFRQASVEGSSIRAWFTHADGLHSNNAEIGDFEVAGEDHQFKPATARLEKVGDEFTIVATSAEVAAPRYIRYGWNPVINTYLYNAGTLPMSPFTSESDAWALGRGVMGSPVF